MILKASTVLIYSWPMSIGLVQCQQLATVVPVLLFSHVPLFTTVLSDWVERIPPGSEVTGFWCSVSSVSLAC